MTPDNKEGCGDNLVRHFWLLDAESRGRLLLLKTFCRVGFVPFDPGENSFASKTDKHLEKTEDPLKTKPEYFRWGMSHPNV